MKQLNICESFHHEKIQAFETVASNCDGLLRVKNGALKSVCRRPGRARRSYWNFYWRRSRREPKWPVESVPPQCLGVGMRQCLLNKDKRDQGGGRSTLQRRHAILS